MKACRQPWGAKAPDNLFFPSRAAFYHSWMKSWIPFHPCPLSCPKGSGSAFGWKRIGWTKAKGYQIYQHQDARPNLTRAPSPISSAVPLHIHLHLPSDIPMPRPPASHVHSRKACRTMHTTLTRIGLASQEWTSKKRCRNTDPPQHTGNGMYTPPSPITPRLHILRWLVFCTYVPSWSSSHFTRRKGAHGTHTRSARHLSE